MVIVIVVVIVVYVPAVAVVAVVIYVPVVSCSCFVGCSSFVLIVVSSVFLIFSIERSLKQKRDGNTSNESTVAKVARQISDIDRSHNSRGERVRSLCLCMVKIRDGYCHRFQRGHCSRRDCKYIHDWPPPGGYQSHLNPALAPAAPQPGATAAAGAAAAAEADGSGCAQRR